MTGALAYTAAASIHDAPPLWLGEPPPDPVSEAELSWIWAGQRYPAGALQLVDGRRLAVRNPGRPGGGAGPDYLDAVVEIDGATVHGDVELHVRSSGFYAHGHDADPAYDRVVLHVVFRDDAGPYTRLRGGGLAAVAAFAPWLEGRTQELQRWLTAEALWREPCRDAVARLGEGGVRVRLREAGLARFRARAERLAEQARGLGEHEALWQALVDAMGVGGDREGFRRLAAAFPHALAHSIVAGPAPDDAARRLTGCLLHAAGLGAQAPGGAVGLPAPLRPPVGSPGRPANRPENRLAGLAELYARSGCDLPAFVRESVQAAASAKALVAAWQVSRRGVTLIGPGRARELALNVALPFAALDGRLAGRVASLLEGLGAGAPYGKTAFLEAGLRSAGGRRIARTALEQQGLLAFLTEWCSRGGCGRCPLS